MSSAAVKALVLCTSCNTAFTGPKCPTCGKTVDNIYAESETKEELMEVVNQHFSAEFSLPSEIYTLDTKPGLVKEWTFIRGLVGETNKIHAISGRFDTAVRLGQNGGYKGFFAWFLADKKEKFDGSLSTDVAVSPFHQETDSFSLTINLDNCISLAEADFVKETPLVEDFLASVCWALLNIFVTLAQKEYYFPIPQDDQVFVEIKDDRVLCVKYIVLDNPKKYVGDTEYAQSRNINLFCSYVDSLFTRFCGKVKRNDDLFASQEMFGNVFAETEISASNFEFSHTLYKLLMLIKGGKKSTSADGKGEKRQEISTLKQFIKGVNALRGAASSQFPVDFPTRPNCHASQKIFGGTFDTSYTDIKCFEEEGNSNIFLFSDPAPQSNFFVAALFDINGNSEQAHHFAIRLSQFVKEYVQIKFFGGPSLATKGKTTTVFYSKLKAKLKTGSSDYVETYFLRDLEHGVIEEINRLNAEAEHPKTPSYTLAFIYKRDDSLNIVQVHSGSSDICLLEYGKVKCTNLNPNSMASVYQRDKIGTDGSIVISTRSGIESIQTHELNQMVTQRGSAKHSLYNILFTSLLRGSSGNSTVFVLKPIQTSLIVR